ncbi:glycosyl transferase family 2 [Nocardioides psychrotolerans]|uniref:Glycosyltransferase involved in cell wall bisynthesis n=1 Tax=Nocardioides psychrotolerans TaxID=1005945 RepID=A0A1I3BDE6_9ACTN|nr:glycosyltransferase family 2 protein [Nocardioides psychrotolerans]GEP36701.1 glycosyl transferase family 2 [Nocardioides psychrotolerans]SFH60312.1 Glycosyltransferase involved in cell wall bisynthesis [Nocardioides psychrotolerans]
MLRVVVPALNEAENLRVLVPRIVSEIELFAPGGGVLVVDDGSSDDTGKVMAELMADLPSVELITLRHNLGKAAALQRGFEAALEDGAQVVAMMDADGQDDPRELGRLLEAVEQGADLVTGARLKRQDRLVKRHTSRLYNRATAMLSGAPGRDFNSGFKMMRAGVAADVSPMLYGEMHRYLTVIAHGLGYRVTEVPVAHHPRMSGSSKYGLARFWRGFVDLLTVRFLLSYEHRPSHLFSAVGAVSLLLGVLTLGYLTVVKLTGQSIGERPLLLAGVLFVVVGVQLVLFGLLAELVVNARNRGTERRT